MCSTIRIRIYQRKSQLFPNAHSLISVSNPARAHKSPSFSHFLLLRPRHHLIVAKAYLFFPIIIRRADGRRRCVRCLLLHLV